MSDERMSDAAVATWHEAMRFASPLAGGSPIDRVLQDHLRARRVEQEQAEQLRQKDETIRALAVMLEHVTHVASGLHLLYRSTANADSDGSHEKLFADAMVLVTKARKP